MLCAMFLFASADLLAKMLTASVHPVQIIWFRQLGLVAGTIILLAIKGPAIFRSQQPGLQVARGILIVFSSLMFVFAVRHVQLAEAIAASFVAPFIVTLLGALMLKESVRGKQWLAIALGFVGALVVVRPGLGIMHPAIFLVFGAAGLYALRQVIGRLLADTDKTATTIAYSAIVSCLVVSVPLPFFWTWPETNIVWLYFFGMAALAAIGEVLIIKSLEVTQAATVAPLHYTILIWGTMYGYLIFGELPDYWTMLGAGIIVVAGLYTLHLSQRT